MEQDGSEGEKMHSNHMSDGNTNYVTKRVMIFYVYTDRRNCVVILEK